MTKFNYYFLSLLLFFAPAARPMSTDSVRFSVAAVSVAVAGYYGYKYVRTPDTRMPEFNELAVVSIIPVEKTQDNLLPVCSFDDAKKALKKTATKFYIDINEKRYLVTQGIPDEIFHHQQVTIYSGGCGAVGTHAPYGATRLLKAGSIHGACIAYINPHDFSRARFNFCQKQDIECLGLVYNALLEKNAKAQVILRGSSKGATDTLSFLAHKALLKEDISAIKAVVLDSPPLSFKKALSHYPGSHALARLILPNYDPNQKTILDAEVMPGIPLFFGRIPGDVIADADEIVKMAQHMNALRNDKVWCFTAPKSVKHGGITTLPEHTLALNAFYKQHGLNYALPQEQEAQAEKLLHESKINS